MRVAIPHPSKPATFALLMAASIVLLLLPEKWTILLRGCAQPLAWFQRPVAAAARSVREALPDGAAHGLSAAEATKLQDELEELRRRVAQQELAFAELRSTITALTGIRDHLPVAKGRIVIAAVLSMDASPRRESISIAVGSGAISGLREGLWVTAGRAAEDESESSGRDLVAEQWLLGRISEVHPFVSRVQLATDASFGPVRVRAGATREDGTWQVMPDDCLLSGRGEGRMRIERCPVDYFAAGARIVLVPASIELPAMLTIGRIDSARVVPEAPLFRDLEVRSWGDARRLRYVYVIIPGT